MRALVLLVILTPVAGHLTPRQCDLRTTTLTSSEQTERQTISKLAHELYSTRTADRIAAREKLLTLASHGTEERSEVIRSLIMILDDLQDPKGPWADVPQLATMTTWHAAAGLLGELRATEAIDTLINYLDYTDPVGTFTLKNFPAVTALIQIGESSIPALVEALQHNKPSIRMNAARALGNIGSAKAKDALERALLSETDTMVIDRIRLELAAMEKGRPKI